MLRTAAVALGALLLASCTNTAAYRLQETEFKPGADRKTFTFRALAAADIGGFDTPEGRARHMKVLEEWLRLNDMCPSNYEITSHRAVVDADGLFGKRGPIYYEGRCKA
jgi:hypothetical protein